MCSSSYHVPVLPTVTIDFDGYVCRSQLFCSTGFVEPYGGYSFVPSSF